MKPSITTGLLHARRIAFTDGSELTDKHIMIVGSLFVAVNNTDPDGNEMPPDLYPLHTVKCIESVEKIMIQQF